MAEKKPDKFTDLLTKLARVPKVEIDEREREYQEERKKEAPAAKAGAIVPPLPAD